MCDFFMGYITYCIYTILVASVSDLKSRIVAVIETVDANILQPTWKDV